MINSWNMRNTSNLRKIDHSMVLLLTQSDSLNLKMGINSNKRRAIIRIITIKDHNLIIKVILSKEIQKRILMLFVNFARSMVTLIYNVILPKDSCNNHPLLITP